MQGETEMERAERRAKKKEKKERKQVLAARAWGEVSNDFSGGQPS